MRQSLAGFLIMVLAACQQQQAKSPPPAPEITFDGADVSDAAATIQHGQRLTLVLGCTDCHQSNLQGAPFYDLYAPNLTRELPKYSDAQLDQLVRHGERPNGKALWSMPASVFQHLSDRDFKALLAYLRTLKPGGIPTPAVKPLGPDAKARIAQGLLKSEAQMVAETRTQLPFDAGQQYALGRYIAEVTCAECHGPKLKGHPNGRVKIPDLVVAGGYSRTDFERLMTTGIPVGNRKLNPIMSGTAKLRFVHFTPHERDALYGYLKARAEKTQ
jgi:mono/diheme cytochrome c family protein